MFKLTCIIVEDEPLARQILEGYIAKVSFLDLQGSFGDAIEATAHLHEQQVDLMFLDIFLPEIQGLRFLKTLPEPPLVIITTAYHEYALESYELNVVDYLLKPFEFERFLAAVHKVKKMKQLLRPVPATEKDYFFVNIQLKKVKVFYSDILYIESQKEYVKIVTARQSYLTKMSTHEMEAILPAALFQRVHRSFIIALDKVGSYNAEMVEINGDAIPVGRNYRHILENL